MLIDLPDATLKTRAAGDNDEDILLSDFIAKRMASTTSLTDTKSLVCCPSP